jgi:hypothetical protein
MKRALAAVILGAAVVTVAGCGGTTKIVSPPAEIVSPPPIVRAADRGPELAGEVQVVAYPRGKVRICTTMFSDLVYGPPQVPSCQRGLRVTGVDVSALKSREKGKPERWGYVYLVGRYANGTFHVTSQAAWPPKTHTHDPSAKVPCPTPAGGWHANGVDSRPYPGMVALRHYGKTTGHHDITSVAFFDKGDVLTLASTNPARTRRVLGPYFPRQLCVVKSRYARKTVARERGRMLRLLRRNPSSPGAAAWGWPQGGGGEGVSPSGQPTTGLDVFIVTPKLRAYLDRQPRGLVVVDATLHPLARR